MTFFVLGTLILLALLSWATYKTAAFLAAVPPQGNMLLLPGENLVRIVLIAFCIALGRISGLPIARLGWSPSNPLPELVIGCLVGVLVALSLPPLTRLAVKRFGTRVYSPVVVLAVMPRSRQEWRWVPLALVTSVLLEELLFRSLLLGGFSSFLPTVPLMLIWSILFGTMHLPQGNLGMLAASVLGLLLSVLFILTGSLLAPFVSHYTIDLLQMIWAYHDKNWLDAIGTASSHP